MGSAIDFSGDIDRVNQISIVPSLLDIICQTTGMGFAAVARVTQDRWVACRVQDDIQFGLVPGGELLVETTICSEIRDSYKPVIIDSVETDAQYCNHHTPARYGFKSYVSFPIILKNGEFFGTLCAIDPKPAQLNNPKIIGLFTAFADLISFHLQQIELMEASQDTLKTLNHQLINSRDENRQYHHISNHSLQEPLRKIRIFSGLMVDSLDNSDTVKAKDLALKISSNAQRLSMMIKDLRDFTELSEQEPVFEMVDLNQLIDRVCDELSPQMEALQAVVHVDVLPAIQAIPWQLERLFYHLLHNSIKFSRNGVAPRITISVDKRDTALSAFSTAVENLSGFVDIHVSDNGIGIEKSQLDKIFNIFSHVPLDKIREGEGIGLAYCRKVMRNHAGRITVHSEAGEGTTFSIRLPIEKR